MILRILQSCLIGLYFLCLLIAAAWCGEKMGIRIGGLAQMALHGEKRLQAIPSLYAIFTFGSLLVLIFNKKQ